METISCVFTSCGRFDLLERTFKSFVQQNTYPIQEYIIIENSALPNAEAALKKFLDPSLNVKIIINETNIGQVASIDKAYSFVKSDYIFHCEDDWEFFDSGFLEKSLDVLQFNPKLTNVSLRIRFDGERGSMHPVSDKMSTTNGTIYHEYLPAYLGIWHGFSWNPGLRRLSDYLKVAPYKQYQNEQGVGKVFYEMGYKSACLEKFYCKHIGTNSTTSMSNQ